MQQEQIIPAEQAAKTTVITFSSNHSQLIAWYRLKMQYKRERRRYQQNGSSNSYGNYKQAIYYSHTRIAFSRRRTQISCTSHMNNTSVSSLFLPAGPMANTL